METSDNNNTTTNQKNNTNQNTTNDSSCNHNFIVDYIDVTPEKSERIIYCTKCEQCAESIPKQYN